MTDNSQTEKSSKRGPKTGTKHIKLKYELHMYNFVEKRWDLTKLFATLDQISDFLDIKQAMIQQIFTNKHKLLNKIFKIVKI